MSVLCRYPASDSRRLVLQSFLVCCDEWLIPNLYAHAFPSYLDCLDSFFLYFRSRAWLLTLVATICLVAAIVSSSSMAYWFSLWNSLSIVVGGCSESKSKNWVLGRMTCFTACRIVSRLTASSWRIAAPKRFIKSLMNSDCPIRTWKRLVTLCFLLTEHMYLGTNFSNRHQKEVTVFGIGDETTTRLGRLGWMRRLYTGERRFLFATS